MTKAKTPRAKKPANGNTSAELALVDKPSVERTETLVDPEGHNARGPGEQVEVVLDELEVDAEWNARRVVDEKQMKELAASIRTNGLLQPLVVTKSQPDGEPSIVGYRYKLVSGFRRTWAIKGLGWTKARAVVVSDASAAELFVMNLVENVQREDVRVWEVADRCFLLTQPPHSLEGKEIARMMGKSAPYINNLIRLRRNLVPELWEKLASAEGSEKVTLPQWMKIAGQPHEQQMATYQRLLKGLDRVEAVKAKEEKKLDGADGEPPPEEERERPAKTREENTVRSETEIRAMLSLTSQTRKANAFRDGALMALLWAIGEGPPPAKEKGPAKEKAPARGKGAARG